MNEAFLRMIHENADDDTDRLVFSDWLEDNGEPEQAELIRLQVSRARREAPIRGNYW